MGHRAPPQFLILQSVYIIENMILTTYLNKSYFVEAKVDMLEAQQVDRGQIHNIYVASVVLLYHDCKTSKCRNKCFVSLTTCEVLGHAASFLAHYLTVIL